MIIDRRNRRRGSTIVETAMLMMIMLLLLSGVVQLGRLTYIYYTLRKTVYSIAMFLSSQQGADICNGASDPVVTAAINFGLTGTTDGSQPVFVNGLTAAMIQVTAEQFDPTALTTTACCPTACDTANGGSEPSYITVSIIPNSYYVQMRFPLITVDPIPLQPEVKVPYGGT